MYTGFEKLNKSSKVWVFQSSSEIPASLLQNISNDSKDFLEQLNSHGRSLKSSFKLIYNHFLIIAVENSKNEISGCSIDTITRFVKNLELKYNLSFFDRLIVKYKKNNENIKSASLNEFKTICKTKMIDDDITVFNNLVKNIDELENIWETNIHNSWLKDIWMMRNIKLIIYIFLFSHLVFSQTKDPLMSEDFEKQSVWVDSIYNSMTLDEKIGQLFVQANSFESNNSEKVKSLIKNQKIGGLIFSKGTPNKQISLTKSFQKISKVPLLISMDAEWDYLCD